MTSSEPDPTDASRSKHGNWLQAISSFVVSILVLLAFRWALFEPYVIPSGSMLPTLQVLDYIYVNKFAYGVRIPFSSQWIWKRKLPERCEVVVFRSKTMPGQFVIKRVLGLPGETIELLQSGRIRVDGVGFVAKELSKNETYQVLEEECIGGMRHAMQVFNQETEALNIDPVVFSVTVPEDELALFGDNRHESADSREWGTLHRDELLGKAQGIWLSCATSITGLPRVCDPTGIRWARMFGDFDRSAIEMQAGK